MIRCVVFDFDGTLVHSNEVKRRGFFRILGPNPRHAARMAEILEDPPGDRTAIIASYAREFGENAEALLEAYTSLVSAEILECPLRDGANEILSLLGAAGIAVHVNSATPQVHLIPAVKALFGERVFDGIHGGHGKKLMNLRTLMEANKYDPADVAVVGDGIDDRECAAQTGAKFFGVGGGTLQDSSPCAPVLGDLRDLAEILALHPPARIGSDRPHTR